MITLAHATQHTKAKPEAIFALWADINHWHEFDHGIEWARLTQEFAAGAHYTIKPKGGPKVKATILTADAPIKFVDVSHLFGARLHFDHAIISHADDNEVVITITLSGPLRAVWAKILGKNQQADLEAAIKQLIKKAETA